MQHYGTVYSSEVTEKVYYKVLLSTPKKNKFSNFQNNFLQNEICCDLQADQRIMGR